ncbi:hypothetical protein KP509_01G128400 [Ceratopteris richardii]|uniref:Uncharacterized protein n=1 Tax=Ceratopteris richardii TaxID=49495 RepID=A0A8T2VP73_CERRI|nr:hypothetical protein KP509_01G128400 [Ceratopteris richardii]
MLLTVIVLTVCMTREERRCAHAKDHGNASDCIHTTNGVEDLSFLFLSKDSSERWRGSREVWCAGDRGPKGRLGVLSLSDHNQGGIQSFWRSLMIQGEFGSSSSPSSEMDVL